MKWRIEMGATQRPVITADRLEIRDGALLFYTVPPQRVSSSGRVTLTHTPAEVLVRAIHAPYWDITPVDA